MTFQEKLDESYEAGLKAGREDILHKLLQQGIISEEQAEAVKKDN